MNTDDLVFFFNTAAATGLHQTSGAVALKSGREIIKSYIKERPDLQDLAVLKAYDNLLQISSAAEVPAVFVPTPFEPSDYVESAPETETIEPVTTFDHTLPWKKRKKRHEAAHHAQEDVQGEFGVTGTSEVELSGE